MITIRDIDHIVFRVHDLETMARFYVDVLGARFEQYQEHVDLYQLRIGNALIDLIPADGKLGKLGGPPPGRDGHNVDHVCFRVLPWDETAIRTHLAHHGITDVEIASRYGADGEGPSIYLTDPEGNHIELKGPPWAPQKTD